MKTSFRNTLTGITAAAALALGSQNAQAQRVTTTQPDTAAVTTYEQMLKRSHASDGAAQYPTGYRFETGSANAALPKPSYTKPSIAQPPIKKLVLPSVQAQAPYCDPSSTIIANVTRTAPNATSPFRTQFRALSNYDGDKAVEAAVRVQDGEKWIIVSGDDHHPRIVPSSASAKYLGTDLNGRGLINLDVMRKDNVNHRTLEGDAYFDNNGVVCKQPYQLHVEFAGANKGAIAPANYQRIAQRQTADSLRLVALETKTDRTNHVLDSLAGVADSRYQAQTGRDNVQDERISRDSVRINRVEKAVEAIATQPKAAPTAQSSKPSIDYRAPAVSPVVSTKESKPYQPQNTSTRATTGYIALGGIRNQETTTHNASVGTIAGTDATCLTGYRLEAGIAGNNRWLIHGLAQGGSISGASKSQVNPRTGVAVNEKLTGNDHIYVVGIDGTLKYVGAGVGISMRSTETNGGQVGQSAWNAGGNRVEVSGQLTAGPQRFHALVGASKQINDAEGRSEVTVGQEKPTSVFAGAEYKGLTLAEKIPVDFRVVGYRVNGGSSASTGVPGTTGVNYVRSGISGDLSARVLKIGNLGLVVGGSAFSEKDQFGSNNTRTNVQGYVAGSYHFK